jgi:hypothetical protein
VHLTSDAFMHLPVCGHHLHVPVHDACVVIDVQLVVVLVEAQSESVVEPLGQQPSPFICWVMSVCLHVAAHVPAPSHVSAVHLSVSEH